MMFIFICFLLEISATPVMEGILDLHHTVFFFIVVIFTFVMSVFIYLIIKFNLYSVQVNSVLFFYFILFYFILFDLYIYLQLNDYFYDCGCLSLYILSQPNFPFFRFQTSLVSIFKRSLYIKAQTSNKTDLNLNDHNIYSKNRRGFIEKVKEDPKEYKAFSDSMDSLNISAKGKEHINVVVRSDNDKIEMHGMGLSRTSGPDFVQIASHPFVGGKGVQNVYLHQAVLADKDIVQERPIKDGKEKVKMEMSNEALKDDQVEQNVLVICRARSVKTVFTVKGSEIDNTCKDGCRHGKKMDELFPNSLSRLEYEDKKLQSFNNDNNNDGFI